MSKVRRLKELSAFSLNLIKAEDNQKKKKIENIILREGIKSGIESLRSSCDELYETIIDLTITHRILNAEIRKYEKKRDKKINSINTINT